jgi:hypothetical protein
MSQANSPTNSAEHTSSEPPAFFKPGEIYVSTTNVTMSINGRWRTREIHTINFGGKMHLVQRSKVLVIELLDRHVRVIPRVYIKPYVIKFVDVWVVDKRP